MKRMTVITSVAALSAAFLTGAALADTEITLPDPGFAPEGIAADSDGELYTGSLTQGKIVRVVPETGVVTDFAAPGANGMVSVVGMHVADDLVFACSSDPGVSALTGTAAPALVAFDRQSGEATGRYDLPEGGPSATISPRCRTAPSWPPTALPRAFMRCGLAARVWMFGSRMRALPVRGSTSMASHMMLGRSRCCATTPGRCTGSRSHRMAVPGRCPKSRFLLHSGHPMV